jgi:Holliday junction resolvase RusA-like endonuclease
VGIPESWLRANYRGDLDAVLAANDPPEPKRPRRAKAPPILLLPSGTLIVRFEVPGRAVPWKVPTVTKRRGAFKDKRLVAWQETVAEYARAAMAGREPYAGPVRLDVRFEIKRRAGSMPDRTNCLKAAEDALQGIVFTNDRLVIGGDSERVAGERDLMVVVCWAA